RFSNTILTVSAVYGSYALAVALGTSGLISVAIVGLYYGSVTLQKYTRPSSRESVRTFWQFAAFLGNSVAFLFVGLSTNLFQVINGLGYIAVAYISVLISRIASVLPVMYFFDPRRKAIPAKWNAVMVLGGMRGAVSIALAASVPIGTLDSNIISTMVLGVAFISITLQGLFLARYISRNFPEEQRSGIEERRLQLYRTIASLETLQAAHERALISDEEFTVQLEEERDKLFEIIEDTGNDDRLDEKLKSDFRKLHAQLLQNKNKDNRPEVSNVESLRKSAEEAIIILTSSTIKS
ncbi:MAG: cation:proton antiporter, partial [Conexivisphaerales archaeon]